MSTQWQDRDRLKRLSEKIFRGTTQDIKPRGRFDIVLLVGFLVGLTGVAFLLFLIFQVADLLGLRDQTLLQPLADDRKLVNIRDHINEKVLLDAVYHGGDERVYLSQDGGAVHRYDPRTRLWSSELPFGEESGIGGQPVRLRSGNGDDQAASGPNAADPGSLWALSDRGGLARRGLKDWETVFADSAFNGTEDSPISTASLTSAAASEDGTWLAVGTQKNGVGLYHVKRRQWMKPDENFTEQFNSVLKKGEVTHLVWWRDRFWVGGPDGLLAFSPTERGPVFERKSGISDCLVTDLDADPQGFLWVLARKYCADRQGKACILFAAFESPEVYKTVIDEESLFPDLDLGDLFYAQQSSGRLTLAGEIGIYCYNTARHTWSRPFEGRILEVHPLPDKGFYFGYVGGFGYFADNSLETWPLSGQRVVKLSGESRENVLALTEAGRVYGFDTNGGLKILFRGTRDTGPNRSYTHAVSMGDDVLLIGPKSAVIHNVVSREYEDLDLENLPDWLRSPTTRLLFSSNHIFGLTNRTGSRGLYSLSRVALKSHRAGRQETNLSPVSNNARLRLWGDSGVGLIDDLNPPCLFGPKSRTPILGPKVSSLNGESFVDVTQFDKKLVVSAGRDVRFYNLEDRTWSEPANSVKDTIVQLEGLPGMLLARTDSGVLYRAEPNDQKLNFLSLMGRDPLGITDEGLSDVYQDPSTEKIYLAGEGHIVSYNQSTRRVTSAWDLPTKTTIELITVIGGSPVTLADKNLYVGEKLLDREAGPVLSITNDENWIWTVRSLDGTTYLKGYDQDGPSKLARSRCFFRNPNPASAIQQIIDARQLPGGEIAVATDAGLHFYSNKARSWFPAAGNLIPKGGRLYLLEKELLLVEKEKDGVMLSFIPLQSILFPHSCAVDQVELTAYRKKVSRVTVNEADDEIIMLLADGSIIKRSQTREWEVLAKPGGGPNPKRLRRVFSRFKDKKNRLWFTTDKELFRYDLNLKSWLRVTIRFEEPAKIVDMTMTTVDEGELITVSTEDGNFYLGNLPEGEREVLLQRVYETSESRFGKTAQQLVDVQGDEDSIWSFVVDDGLRFFDPDARVWLKGLKVNTTSPPVLTRMAGLDVVIGNKGSSWWIPRRYAKSPGGTLYPANFARFDLGPKEKVALDSDKTVWRLTDDGRLMLAKQSQSEDYLQFAPFAPGSFLMDAKQVTAAYQWGRWVLFVTAAGTRVFDKSRGTEVALPAEAVDFRSITSVHKLDKDLFLIAADRLLHLTRNQRGAVVATITQGISGFKQDRDDNPWARFVDGWRIWDRGRFIPPQGGLPASGLSLTVVNGSQVTGVDGANRPYAWKRRWLGSGATLPKQVGSDTDSVVLTGAANDWWVLNGRTLFHVKPKGRPGSSLILAGRLEVPKGFGATDMDSLLNVRILIDNSFRLTGSSGKTLTVKFDGRGNYTPSLGATPGNYARNVVPDSWPTLAAFVKQLPNGSEAFDPFTDLAVNNKNQLIALRPSGELKLADLGAVAPKRGKAFDSGWISWDRQTREFVVGQMNQRVKIPATDFIVDGRLLFEGVEALSPETRTRFHAANRHGIWTFAYEGLNLNDASIVFTRQAMPGKITAARGLFYFAGGSLEPGDKRAGRSIDQNRVSYGEVVIEDNPRAGSVSASINANGRTIGAFAEHGFLWDRDRRDVVFQGRNLLVQSGAGLHRANDLAGFDLGPPGTNLNKGELISEPTLGLLFRQGSRWYRKTASGWEADIADPEKNRILFKDKAWTWSLNKGRLSVTLVGANEIFPLGAKGFAWDRLRGATVLDDEMYVMTDAFFEARALASEIARISALRFPVRATTRLETRRLANDKQVLLRYNGEEVSAWNMGTFVFENGASALATPILETTHLRFLRTSSGIGKELRLTRPETGPAWVPYRFVNDRFPFDVVTALASDEHQLYVGTKAGLQVYPPKVTLSMNSLRSFYDMRSATIGEPVAVYGIERDQTVMGRIIVRGARAVLVKEPNQPFTRPTQAPQPGNTVLLDSKLWQWVRDTQGHVSGRYKLDDRKLDNSEIAISEGHFPHDRILDFARWQDRAFSLWGDNYVTAHQLGNLKLSQINHTKRFVHALPRHFIVVGKPLLLPEGTVRAGIYLACGSNTYFFFEDGEWVPWPEGQLPVLAAAIESHHRVPPLFEGRDLRLMPALNRKPISFEQRTIAGNWLPIGWIAGRVAIDHFYAIEEQGGRLWAATPAGFSSFRRNAFKDIRLDPDDLILIRDLIKLEPLSRVTDMIKQDGDILARLDQDSGKVYRGTLSNHGDRNLFKRESGMDPFAERTWIDKETSGFWEWKLSDRRDGKAGYLTVRLGAETPQIVGGRFDFDTIDSIALFQAGDLEVGTESGGWYRLPRDDVHIRNLKRPLLEGLDSLSVRRVGITLSGDQRQLVLGTYNDEAVRLGERGVPERVAVFSQILARAGPWDYYGQDGKLMISTTLGKGGAASRTMERGRFLDDVITGLPISVGQPENPSYLVPTRAGVISLNGGLSGTGIRVAPFSGLAHGEVPAVLFPDGKGRVVYAGRNDFHYLDQDQEVFAPLKVDAPNGFVLVAMARGPGSSWRCQWEANGERGWNRMRGKDMGSFPRRKLYINIRNFERFQENRIAWGEPSPWLVATFEGDHIDLKLQDFETRLPVDLPAGFDLAAPVLAQKRLLLFGKRDLYELNLEKALADIFANLGRFSRARLETEGAR